MTWAVVSPINNTVTEHVLNPQKDPIILYRSSTKIAVMEKVATACVTAAAESLRLYPKKIRETSNSMKHRSKLSNNPVRNRKR